MEITLCEIFHYMKETSRTLFYSKQKFFCEYTKCCIVVERFSNQFDLLFIPTKRSLELLKSLIAEKNFIDTINHFVERFGFQNLFYRLRIQTYAMYEEGPLIPGFIRCELYPGIVKYGQVYTKVRVVVEEENGFRDYSVKIDLMSNWSLRELSNFMATNECINPIGFYCANSFAKNFGEDTPDEAIENDAILISEIYTKNLQITLFQGDFGTVLM